MRLGFRPCCVLVTRTRVGVSSKRAAQDIMYGPYGVLSSGALQNVAIVKWCGGWSVVGHPEEEAKGGYLCI